MLLGQGMRVLHMLVRTVMVMVMVMVKVDGVLWHSPLRHPLLPGAPPRLGHRYRFRHRPGVLRRSWVLLGQGMWVLHMLVRTVMVMVMVKVDWVLWHSPLRHPLLLGAPPRLRHRYRFRHRPGVLRRSSVLLGQGMWVLHMLVRTVMVMVMVKVDWVLWHSPLRHPLLLGARPRLRHRYRLRHRHCVLRRP